MPGKFLKVEAKTQAASVLLALALKSPLLSLLWVVKLQGQSEDGGKTKKELVAFGLMICNAKQINIKPGRMVLTGTNPDE